MLNKIVLKHSSIKKTQLKGKSDKVKDWYFGVNKAKKLGVIDIIL